MDLEKMKARLAEIVASVGQLSAVENVSEKEVEQINALSAEFEGLKGKIEAKEKSDAILAAAAAPNRQVAPTAAAPRVEVIGNKKEDANFGYQSSGEYFKGVINFAKNGNTDPRIERVLNTSQNEGVGMDGGFLVPSDLRQDIQKKIMGDDSLLPLTRQFRTASNKLELPVNEVAPWDGSGIQALWGEEEGTHSESKTKFGLAEWKLHKLTAFVKITDELMEDAPAIESYVRQEAPEALVHKINAAIIAGDGTGKPLGFLNSGFKYKVSKEGGQAADTIRFENINNMYGHLLPQSVGKAFWLCHPAALPQLRLMKFDNAAASPVPVYLPGNSVAGFPHGTLMGLPIKVMMGGVKSLGDEGDISLVDLSYYFTVMKTNGFKSEVNPYLYWDKDVKALKFQIRLGGHCPFKAPVSPENGTFPMSSFVTLEDR